MVATIKDVAKLANVNPSTVSRVIANNPRISEKTKRIVREAMDKLGYYPNHHARSLVNQSTQTIGVVMPNSDGALIQNPFFPQVIQGISKAAHDHGFGIYMTTGMSSAEIENEVKSMVHGRRVDGLILLYSRIGDELVDFLKTTSFPFVIIGKPYRLEDKITHVDNDNVQATIDATNYLLELGHTKCGFIGGALDLVVTLDRKLGYTTALQKARIPVREDYIVHTMFEEEGGREAIKKLFSISDPPTGLIVTDDVMALGVISYLNESGVRVPEDVSILSFNNSQICRFCSPPLTSIDINIFDLGLTASNALFDLMSKRADQPRRILVPHELVKRQSCSMVARVDQEQSNR